jgi:hypothetical protein
MRHILNSALEGFHVPGTTQFLSLEEEGSVIAETTAEGAAIDSDLTEVDRLADMSDALEDLAVTADAIEGEAGDGVPTDNEAALIETVASAAVAGTDVDSSEIVPAMESHGGKRRYAAETIRERARSIWEAIKRVLKQVWDKITSFLYKIFGTLPTLRRRLEELKKRVQDNSNKTVDEKKITVSTGVASLSANYKTPSNAAELRKNFLTLLNTSKAVFVDEAGVTLSLGEAVLDGINDFEPDAAEATAAKFVEKVTAEMKKASNKLSTTAVSGNRFGDSVDAKMTEPLLGNVSIVMKRPTFVEHKAGSGSTLGKLEQMRGFACEVVQTSEKPKDVPNNFEMSTASNSEMLHLVEDALELVDVLEKFQKGKKADDMKKLKGKLDTASDKATTAMNKLNGKEDKAETAAIPYYRALLNFNQAYARWVKDPALPMVSHSLASIRSVVNVVQKSLSNYKAA